MSGQGNDEVGRWRAEAARWEAEATRLAEVNVGLGAELVEAQGCRWIEAGERR